MKRICKFIVSKIKVIYYWLKYGSEAKEYKGLPQGCWYCELLGICRKPKENGWVCINGCVILGHTRNNKN